MSARCPWCITDCRAHTFTPGLCTLEGLFDWGFVQLPKTTAGVCTLARSFRRGFVQCHTNPVYKARLKRGLQCTKPPTSRSAVYKAPPKRGCQCTKPWPRHRTHCARFYRRRGGHNALDANSYEAWDPARLPIPTGRGRYTFLYRHVGDNLQRPTRPRKARSRRSHAHQPQLTPHPTRDSVGRRMQVQGGQGYGPQAGS